MAQYIRNASRESIKFVEYHRCDLHYILFIFKGVRIYLYKLYMQNKDSFTVYIITYMRTLFYIGGIIEMRKIKCVCLESF